MKGYIMLAMAYKLFSDWLSDQMEKEGITQAELSRRSGVTRSTINSVMTGRRNAGADLCRSIAKGLNLPPADVFAAAGLLPQSVEDNLVNTIAHLSDQLPPEERMGVIEFIKMRLRVSNDKKKSKRSK
jgi:transcriptional regulator with XRE-family HTH domain